MCTTNCSHFLRCEFLQNEYNCTCQPGFSGLDCDINIDDCSSNPCVNGKCVDGVSRYDCDCNKGYWGVNCEKKIINEEGMMVTDVISLKQNDKRNVKKFFFVHLLGRRATVFDNSPSEVISLNFRKWSATRALHFLLI